MNLSFSAEVAVAERLILVVEEEDGPYQPQGSNLTVLKYDSITTQLHYNGLLELFCYAADPPSHMLG